MDICRTRIEWRTKTPSKVKKGTPLKLGGVSRVRKVSGRENKAAIPPDHYQYKGVWKYIYGGYYLPNRDQRHGRFHTGRVEILFDAVHTDYFRKGNSLLWPAWPNQRSKSKAIHHTWDQHHTMIAKIAAREFRRLINIRDQGVSVE